MVSAESLSPHSRMKPVLADQSGTVWKGTGQPSTFNPRTAGRTGPSLPRHRVPVARLEMAQVPHRTDPCDMVGRGGLTDLSGTDSPLSPTPISRLNNFNN